MAAKQPRNAKPEENQVDLSSYATKPNRPKKKFFITKKKFFITKKKFFIVLWLIFAIIGLIAFDMLYLIFAPKNSHTANRVVIWVFFVLFNIFAIASLRRVKTQHSEKTKRGIYLVMTIISLILLLSPIVFKEWMRKPGFKYKSFQVTAFEVAEKDDMAQSFQKTLDYVFSLSDYEDYEFPALLNGNRYEVNYQYNTVSSYSTSFHYKGNQKPNLPPSIQVGSQTVTLHQTTLGDLTAQGWELSTLSKEEKDQPRSAMMSYQKATVFLYVDGAGNDPSDLVVTNFSCQFSADKLDFNYHGVTPDSDIKTVVERLGPPSDYDIRTYSSTPQSSVKSPFYNPDHNDEIKLIYQKEGTYKWPYFVFRYDTAKQEWRLKDISI